jgi:hypothetical protein
MKPQPWTNTTGQAPRHFTQTHIVRMQHAVKCPPGGV